MAGCAKTLKEIIHTGNAQDSYAAQLLRENGNALCGRLADFLDNAGYAVTLQGHGSSALALATDNPDYILRVERVISRPRIPHTVQSMATKDFSDGAGIEIEFVLTLPDINGKAGWREEVKAFEQEVELSGYKIDPVSRRKGGIGFYKDLGRFEYGGHSVIMGRDAGIVELKDGDKRSGPVCTDRYVPLDVQWQRQCDILKSDDRLQRLLGAKEPPSFPQTQIIQWQNVGRGMTP